MVKKLMIWVLSASLCVLCAYPLEVKATDFSGREEEMNAKCSVTISDEETLRECEAYVEYVKAKNSSLSSEINSIKSQLSEVGDNIDKLSEQLKANNAEISDLDGQIADVEGTIQTIGNSIKKLNKQIDEKAADIEKRDEQMRERLVEMQVYTGSNNFIDFLMGSSSFADLLRRSEILGELNAYENEQIKALSKEKDALDKDKQKVENQKEMLEVQKTSLNNSRAKAEELKEVNEQLISQYRVKEDELLDQKIKAQMAQVSVPKIDVEIGDQFDDPKDDEGGSSGSEGGNSGGGSSGSEVTPSSDFIVPIIGNWHYSAGTWAYPGGGVHRGMDFGTGNVQGLQVVAPASGIIIWTNDGWPSPSGSNYPCNDGIPQTAGNNITMLTRVNGVVYAFSFYHLSSVATSVGATVSQGQTIGYTGNSGNSTGPHCHVEMIKVGIMSMSDALARWNSSGDLSFGVGWYSDPMACSNYSAPCRLRPEDYFL